MNAIQKRATSAAASKSRRCAFLMLAISCAAGLTASGCGARIADEEVGEDADEVRDRTAPQITITNPVADQTVSGSLSVAGKASDASGVMSVEIDGGDGTWLAAAGTTSWSLAIDTRRLPDGRATIRVRATDRRGNASTSGVSVLVSNQACGDDTCSASETCASCPGDCGICPSAPACGDASCNGTETCSTCAADCGACATGIFVAAGGNWKYLDNGSNAGTAWTAPVFDDSAWKSGPAQLGYGGEGDERTLVGYGPSSSAKFITTYFRSSFSVTNPAAFGGLALRLLIDDGAVVYLNGSEVLRVNMPSGSVSYTTLAYGTPCEDCWTDYSVSLSALRAGTNTIAVEVHQSSASSSDLSFDLELKGITGAAASCGDHSCNGSETCSSCPADCGSCPAVPACGDHSCNGSETCSSCPADCGSCPVVPACGDRSCNGSETCSSCPADCGACSTTGSRLDNQFLYSNWCRTTVHTHPAKTSASTLAGWYEALGYDFIWFTDHESDPWSAPPATRGMVVGKGEEATAEGHCNAFGLSSHISVGTYQEAIDKAKAQGGIVQINHPSRDTFTVAQLEALVGLWGIEIKNESQYTDNDITLWDSQISKGRRFWGTFSDDAHDQSDVGRGWLMVNTPSDCTQAQVLAAMKAGAFYDSEGPRLTLLVSGDTVTVTSDSAVKLQWYKQNRTLLKTTSAASDSYTVDGSEVFVRVVATNASGKVALTMPIFLK